MIIVDDFDNLFCNFVKINNIFECSKCGNKISFKEPYVDEEPPIIPCRSPLLGSNVASKVVDFASCIEGMKHNLCSEEEIKNRHNICSSCEHYINNSCKQCGCSITRDRNYLNKLASKEESCPISKW